MRNKAELLLLNGSVVQSLLDPDAVMDSVRQSFLLHFAQAGRVFPVVREALPAGVFGIKSGDVASRGLLGLKAAGFWSNNRALGSEPHQATIVLMNPANGRPQCILDGNAITTARTAAAGAWGLRLLARPESQTLCVFGTGTQALAQLRYSRLALPRLGKVLYLSSSKKPDLAFEENARAFLAPDISLHLATDANLAVSKSDVVLTCTPGRGALFDLDALKPSTHLNCVGADTRGKRELPEGAIERAKLFVDDLAQARTLGEAQWCLNTPCIELGALMAHPERFARKPEDITIFDLTGLALQDLVTARTILDLAQQRGLGDRVAWPW